MFLLYHAYVYLEFLILACTIYILAPQAPRTTMSIRVSERERRQIEEKAMATGLAASAYIRTMALDDGNVDTTIHEDRQKLMHELSAIGNHINQIARMANTNLFILKSDVQDVKEQLR